MKEEQENKLTLENLVREIFELGGMEFKTLNFIRWRDFDGYASPDPIPVTSLGEFVDGKYAIVITDFQISGIEKDPFLIPEFYIEAVYKKGKWSDLKINDIDEVYELEYEKSDTQHLQYLDNRLQKIIERTLAALELLSMILEIRKNKDNKSRKPKH